MTELYFPSQARPAFCLCTLTQLHITRYGALDDAMSESLVRNPAFRRQDVGNAQSHVPPGRYRLKAGLPASAIQRRAMARGVAAGILKPITAQPYLPNELVNLGEKGRSTNHHL